MTSREIQKTIETCLEDAEWHLKMAEKSIEMEAPNRITINSCIMALIRGTDCLCWLYNGERCETGRSHSLHNVFTQLYNKDELPEKYSKYSDTLRKWVSTEKIKAQYQGQTYSQSEVDRAVKQTRRYLNKCVKPVLREHEVIE